MLQPPPDRRELMSFIARIETSFALVPWSDSVFERSRSIPIVIVWPEEQSLKQVEGFVTMGNSQKPLTVGAGGPRWVTRYVAPAPAPTPTINRIIAMASETVLAPGFGCDCG